MAHYIFIVKASYTDLNGSFHWVRTMGSFSTEAYAWRLVDLHWDRWRQMAWMAGDRTDYIDVDVVRSIAF
jgi:hypothetical protein